MVTQVLALSRSGLSDFVVQRVTAVVLAVYTFWLVGFFVSGNVSYTTLQEFFLSTPMQIFSTLAVLSTIAHAWIGMWTVGTDYLRPAHIGSLATSIRFVYQLLCLLALFIYLLWAMQLVWQF